MRIIDWSSDVCSSDRDLTVTAVADAPTLTASDASGSEDTAIPLDIQAALTDTDGSEALSISITGLPDGARLSHGVEAEPGVWEINPDDLGGLEVFPPSNSDVDFQLTVTAISAEAATGGAAIETANKIGRAHV